MIDSGTESSRPTGFSNFDDWYVHSLWSKVNTYFFDFRIRTNTNANICIFNPLIQHAFLIIHIKNTVEFVCITYSL